MGTASRRSSASRSRSPRENTEQQGQSTAVQFRTPRGNMATNRRGSPQIQTLSQSSPQSQADIVLMTHELDPSHPPIRDQAGTGTNTLPHLSILDLKSVAADIKDTLSAAIAELRIDLRSLSDRVSRTEQTIDDHDMVLQKSTRKIDDHTLQLRDVNRHLEDLDNRGRRRNLRVRGLPEVIEGAHVQKEITTLFNSIMGKPPQSNIDFERIHRALRPRGRDTDPPRDVICCLSDFKLKEEILSRARGQKLKCGDAPVQL